MAEQNPKTKTLGTIDSAKAKKIPGFAKYLEAAKASVEARRTVSQAKQVIKDHIQKTMKEEDIDFTIETNGAVRVFKNLEPKKKESRTGGPDLSDKF